MNSNPNGSTPDANESPREGARLFNAERVQDACASREKALLTLRGLLAMQLVSPQELHDGTEARISIILPVFEVSPEDTFELVGQWILQAFLLPKDAATSMLQHMAMAYMRRQTILGVLEPKDANKKSPDGYEKPNQGQS